MSPPQFSRAASQQRLSHRRDFCLVSPPARPAHPQAVGFIDHQQRVQARAAQRDQLRQLGNVAIHAVDRVHYNQRHVIRTKRTKRTKRTEDTRRRLPPGYESTRQRGTSRLTVQGLGRNVAGRVRFPVTPHRES